MSFKEANEIVRLSAANKLEFKEHTDHSDSPPEGVAGVALPNEAIRTVVGVFPQDKDSCEVQLHAYIEGFGKWGRIPQSDELFGAVEDVGAIERISTAGIDRLYVEILGNQEDVIVKIGYSTT